MFANEIQRGMEWLDEVMPTWLGMINLPMLNLAYPSRCVLGQVFRVDNRPPADQPEDSQYVSGYDYALVRYKFADEGHRERGFSVSPDHPGWGPEEDLWVVLTDEWRDAIRQRKENA